MTVICPTVTAKEPHEYREQMERIADFAHRVHIDLADGVFADNKLINLAHIWWPAGVKADIHLMYEAIKPFTAQLIVLKPNLIIIHAEAVGNFYEIAKPFKQENIKVGVALLAHTPVTAIKPALKDIDHVLIFSGNLGHFGGKADLELLAKVKALKKLVPMLEIGWDGGINESNAKTLTAAGVDVLNVGGAIQRAVHPQKSYKALLKLTKK